MVGPASDSEQQRKLDAGRRMLDKFRKDKGGAKPSPFSRPRASLPESFGSNRDVQSENKDVGGEGAARKGGLGEGSISVESDVRDREPSVNVAAEDFGAPERKEQEGGREGQKVGDCEDPPREEEEEGSQTGLQTQAARNASAEKAAALEAVAEEGGITAADPPAHGDDVSVVAVVPEDKPDMAAAGGGGEHVQGINTPVPEPLNRVDAPAGEAIATPSFVYLATLCARLHGSHAL